MHIDFPTVPFEHPRHAAQMLVAVVSLANYIKTMEPELYSWRWNYAHVSKVIFWKHTRRLTMSIIEATMIKNI
jgi:hypothetical protein